MLEIYEYKKLVTLKIFFEFFIVYVRLCQVTLFITTEALHINWKRPNLKAQQSHLALTLSLQFASLLCSFPSLFFFVFLFNVLFSLSLTQIIRIFYCLNYTLLFLHLTITILWQLVNTVYNEYVIYICPMQLL